MFKTVTTANVAQLNLMAIIEDSIDCLRKDDYQEIVFVEVIVRIKHSTTTVSWNLVVIAINSFSNLTVIAIEVVLKVFVDIS